MTTSPTVKTAPVPPTRHHTAARLAWLLPVLGSVMSGFLRRSVGGLVGDLVVMALVLAGIVAGTYALAGVRRAGRKGIVVPAVVGLAVNGLLVLIFISNLTATRAP